MITISHRLRHAITSWQQLPRSARMWRIALLMLTLVYVGYSYGWWGRSSVALQAALQCISIPGSESVRYAPFMVLTSGCSGLELQSVAPSGFALLFVKDNNPHRETLYLDLRTGARRTIDLSSVPRGRFTRVGLLSDTLILAETAITANERTYHLINLQTNRTTQLTYIAAPNPRLSLPTFIDEATWNAIDHAEYIMVGAFTFTRAYQIVALATPEASFTHGIVIATYDQIAHEQVLRDLTTRGIAYQVLRPDYLQASRFPVFSADAQLDAQTEGIFHAFTGDLIRSSGQARGGGTWRPERWVCNDQAVIYTRPLVYLFDLGPAGAFNFQKWRVPQPTLLLSMPGGGCFQV